MKNQPKHIYLNHGSDAEDFKELREVTWCEDKINDNDLEFIAVAFILSRIKELEAMTQGTSFINGEYPYLHGAIDELRYLINETRK